jgi:hypothetical protein
MALGGRETPKMMALSNWNTPRHGYAVVRTSNDGLETEFVCIERPVNRHDQPDGGPLNYRVRFRAPMWRKGETPKLDTKVVEGDPKFPCEMGPQFVPPITLDPEPGHGRF